VAAWVGRGLSTERYRERPLPVADKKNSIMICILFNFDQIYNIFSVNLIKILKKSLTKQTCNNFFNEEILFKKKERIEAT
jgi:hypothetical protein